MVRWWRLALLVLAGVVTAAAATVLARGSPQTVEGSS